MSAPVPAVIIVGAQWRVRRIEGIAEGVLVIASDRATYDFVPGRDPRLFVIGDIVPGDGLKRLILS